MTAVRDSIRQIDGQSWLIEGKLLLRREKAPSSDLASWSDGNGGFYVLSNSLNPPSETGPLSDTSEIQKVYDAGDVSAVWRFGEAFIKVKKLEYPDATREWTTLQYVRNRQPLDFHIPDVYYHAEFGNHSLIILGRVPGRTLNEIWYGLGETKQQECVRRIANICIDLATWEGEAIGGVDGKQLADEYLTKFRANKNFEPAHLLKSCKEIGMDCSSFVFYHADLGPGNILLDEADGSISIIDWETAGYVPKEWIRTKFHISGGLDLPQRDGNVATTDWRARVGRELQKLGIGDVVDEWWTWLHT
ncbi:hypothetical protein NPX13_g6692 [Xylaria arbuscula]|uniref:Aminoglycoside phosphotransferase domain-containing protein n=1 Tax=Xylaria arbuscula TaxID=114810 RepID=A0A9W8TJW1_9PEZI|nr:hypothetical protein NPX13_g6692 [Xylaria arbuscula]